MSFQISAAPDIPLHEYFTQVVTPFVRERLQSGAFPSLHGIALLLRLTLTSGKDQVEGSWDLDISREGEIRSDHASDNSPHVEIILDVEAFRLTQFKLARQMEYLRILNGRPSKFQTLQRLTGKTVLTLTDASGHDITVDFIFNASAKEQVAVKMTYAHFCDILEGKKNMKLLFLRRKIRHRGSLPLLVASGDVLDPS